jgi:tungstate transport system substrate-binding protein
MDRATYITMKAKISSQVLVERDSILMSYITIIPVNLAKFPAVHNREAMEFVNWLQSKETQIIIRDFGKNKYGEPLFFQFPGREETVLRFSSAFGTSSIRDLEQPK